MNKDPNQSSACTSLGGPNGIVLSPVNDARLLSRYATTTGKSIPTTIDLSNLDGKYSSTQDITITASNIPKGKTIVVSTTGNVTISGNITYNNGPYTNLQDLPQVLIFASNIYIEKDVANIDAWLVAGKNGGTGIIDTCKGHTIGIIDANTCSKKLTINGPVFATKLITNRTHGAGHATKSIDPAEVFNLRPDSYLWAYSQASNFRQAVVTHTNNLPVRW
jgi:hypothetical protein